MLVHSGTVCIIVVYLMSLCKSFHSRLKLAHSCQKRHNLHTNELNTFFCSTSPLKAPNRLKSYPNPFTQEKILKF
jgi:hypothetical protein